MARKKWNVARNVLRGWAFCKMLESGHPPDGWDQLLAEAQRESQRLQESLARATAAQL